ncbi:MAG: serine/threonine-protein phosphatase [Ktedonobacteraceae bacterium]|nr:serine/threonine-protein phosphatase [Ktedonobacteraceae bacterium]
MHIKLTAADKSDVGKQREQNEDCAYKRIESSEEGDRGLFIVADGMGGYRAGEVASKLAIDTISRTLDNLFKPLPDQPTIKLDLNQTVKLPPAESERPARQKTRKLAETQNAASIEEQFRTAIQQANNAILRHGEKQPSARGLGSTVTAMLVQNDQAYIANVGDSRTYLLRGDTLKVLTRDHSLVMRLVEARQIESREIYTHPQRNLIYRSLGAGHKFVEVDIFYEVVQPGDTFLLCSDGLWEMVHDEDLQRVLSERKSPQQICDTLIDLANQNGGEDNITAIVVQVSSV